VPTAPGQWGSSALMGESARRAWFLQILKLPLTFKLVFVKVSRLWLSQLHHFIRTSSGAYD
jgi:hypothetical protein